MVVGGPCTIDGCNKPVMFGSHLCYKHRDDEEISVNEDSEGWQNESLNEETPSNQNIDSELEDSDYWNPEDEMTTKDKAEGYLQLFVIITVVIGLFATDQLLLDGILLKSLRVLLIILDILSFFA
ncbi:MAG: hypothetical protein ACJZ39_01495 [Candidatus Thalassarchaeaceae archaeon]